LATILCFVALAHAGTGYAADTTHHFSIPSEDLAAALEDFGRQSGEEILFNREDTRGKTAHLVSGDYTSSDALSKLLAGSGLAVRQANSHTFVVEPAGSQSSTNNQNQSGSPQESPTAAGLEEIVVTAQKRTERLQDVVDEANSRVTVAQVLVGINGAADGGESRRLRASDLVQSRDGGKDCDDTNNSEDSDSNRSRR